MKRLVVDAELRATKYTDIDEGKGGNDFSVSGILPPASRTQPGSRSSMPRRFRNPDRAAVHFLPSPASSWLTYFNIRELTSRLIFSHSAGVFPRHGTSQRACGRRGICLAGHRFWH